MRALKMMLLMIEGKEKYIKRMGETLIWNKISSRVQRSTLTEVIELCLKISLEIASFG